MLGSHNFSKMCAEQPSTYSPTTMAADGADYPLPTAEAAMHCLRGKYLHIILLHSVTKSMEPFSNDSRCSHISKLVK